MATDARFQTKLKALRLATKLKTEQGLREFLTACSGGFGPAKRNEAVELVRGIAEELAK